MSTAEMNMATNSARALIDARLESVERALFGRLSRAERLDIVGEIESRIDELLIEQCTSGCEPTREDILAVLTRLDPPEAYLDFESVEETSQPALEKSVRPVITKNVSNDERLRKISILSTICGLASFFATILSTAFIYAAFERQSEAAFIAASVIFIFMQPVVASALFFAGMSQLRNIWSIAGLLLGVSTLFLSVLVPMAIIWGFQ